MMISEDFGAFTAHPWLLYLPVTVTTAMQKAQRRCITPVTISTTTSW
jgi:hypothetical protein